MERLSTQAKISLTLFVVGALTAMYGEFGMDADGHYAGLQNEQYTDPYGNVYSARDGVSYSKDDLEGIADLKRYVTLGGLVTAAIGGGVLFTGRSKKGRVRGALSVA